jgi:telomerase reverse transcriptase
MALAESVTLPIPGIVSMYPNYHVTSMKAQPWPRILALLGREGERAMVDLILDCGVFVPVTSGQGLFHQLSGKFNFYLHVTKTNRRRSTPRRLESYHSARSKSSQSNQEGGGYSERKSS